MTRKFRLGQSREAHDLDHREAYSRERGGESKRRQQLLMADKAASIGILSAGLNSIESDTS